MRIASDTQGELDPSMTVIRPPSGWPRVGWMELWHYRDLLTLLVWRDFSARYRQSLIGIGWALLRPIIAVIVFTVVFGRMAGFSSDGVPYPVFNYAGLMPWLYFAGCLTGTSDSLVGSRTLLTRIYFPRLILPISKVANGLIDLTIQFVLLLLMMAWYGIRPGAAVIFIPAFVLLACLAALAVGTWLTALNVKFRDVRHAVPFLAQMWMWMTPVVYASNTVPDQWRLLYSLNPMVGVVDGFRWALLGRPIPDWTMIGVSTAVVITTLLTGLLFFRRMETEFADIV